MLVHISVYTMLNQVYLSIWFLYRSISYYTSHWKSLGKSLGDCNVAVKVPEKVPETFSGTFRSPRCILSYTELYSSLPSISQYIPLDLPTKPFTLWQFLCYDTTQYILSISFWPNFHAMRQLQLYRVWPSYTQLYWVLQVVSFPGEIR